MLCQPPASPSKRRSGVGQLFRFIEEVGSAGRQLICGSMVLLPFLMHINNRSRRSLQTAEGPRKCGRFALALSPCVSQTVSLAINWSSLGVNPDRVNYRVARAPLSRELLIRLPWITPFRLQFRGMSNLGNACGGPRAHTPNKPQQIATEYEPCFGRG
jgi:hypothetical protein